MALAPTAVAAADVLASVAFVLMSSRRVSARFLFTALTTIAVPAIAPRNAAVPPATLRAEPAFWSAFFRFCLPIIRFIALLIAFAMATTFTLSVALKASAPRPKGHRPFALGSPDDARPGTAGWTAS